MKNQNQGYPHENVSLNRVIYAIMLLKELVEYHRNSELPAMANTRQDHYPQVFHSFGNIDLYSRS